MRRIILGVWHFPTAPLPPPTRPTRPVGKRRWEGQDFKSRTIRSIEIEHTVCSIRNHREMTKHAA